MYNEVIKLCKKVNTGNRDENGDLIITFSKTEVFCAIKSVARSEFYTARQAGYDPQIIFEIADYFDYNDEQIVEYCEKFYKVIRTYRTGTTLQIVCAHADREDVINSGDGSNE